MHFVKLSEVCNSACVKAAEACAKAGACNCMRVIESPDQYGTIWCGSLRHTTNAVFYDIPFFRYVLCSMLYYAVFAVNPKRGI